MAMVTIPEFGHNLSHPFAVAKETVPRQAAGGQPGGRLPAAQSSVDVG